MHKHVTKVPPSHFQGKSVSKHLQEAQKKGAKAAEEVHGTEASGSLSAAADGIRETAIIFLALFFLLEAFAIPFISQIFGLMLFFFFFFLWKTGRSALLGWHRLERLHRLIEQERWEVKHHREQEKKELREMYAQKGMQGDLLDRVVDTLMADDNRLLQIMLQEELGLHLESYEHPLKQAFAAGIGVFCTALIGISCYYFFPPILMIIILSLAFAFATYLLTKSQGNALTRSVVWSLSVAILALSSLYLSMPFLKIAKSENDQVSIQNEVDMRQ